MKAKSSSAAADRQASFLEGQSGFYIRRLHQIAAALFMEHTADFGVTPIQFGVMMTAREHPEIDQRTLAGLVRFDTSTIGGVIDRLERRGLIRRNASQSDRRVRLLTLTEEGEKLLDRLIPHAIKARESVLEPLEPEQRDAFLSMVKTLVDAHEAIGESGLSEAA